MGITDQIYLATGLSPDEVAPRIAGALGLELVSDHLGFQVVGQLSWSDEPWFGGNVTVNHEPVLLEEETPETYEPSIMDGYDVEWDIDTSSRDVGVLHRGSRELFEAVVAARLPWPAILVENLTVLLAAWKPGESVTWFPPDTSPDPVHVHIWEPYRRWPPHGDQ